VYLGKYHSWSLAFLSAAVVMVIGLITFAFTKKTLGPIGDSPLMHLPDSKRKLREMMVYAGSFLSIPFILIMVKNTAYTDMFMYTIGPIAVLYLFFEMLKLKNAAEKSKLIAAFLFIAFSVLFWAFFEQSGGSLSLFAANNLDDQLLFFHIDPNVVNNTSNSLFVIIFSPLVGILWIGMNKRKLEPNTVIKFGLGFLFLAAAFYVFYYTRFFVDSEGVTSLNIFALAYLVITLGELCLSPIGLSIITKLSPKHLSGMMMGFWFLGSAYGQYVAGILGAGMSTPNDDAGKMEKLMSYTDGYYQLAIYALICGVVLIIISSLMKKLMQGVK
jgi:POT family proton-dependent oligopeptide transporter